MSEIFNLDDILKEKDAKNNEATKESYVESTVDSDPEIEESELDGYFVPLMYTIFDCYYTKAKSPEEALEYAKHYIEKDFCEYDGYMANPKYFEDCITEDHEEAYETILGVAEDMDYTFVG